MLRWAAKRVLKWALVWGVEITAAGAIYRRTSAFRAGRRIIAYHRISDALEDSFTLKKAHFRDHMAFLSDNHAVVRLEDLASGLSSGDSSGAQSVAVTFDDGYEEAAGFVAETLQRYRVPATFFVVTGKLDSEDPADRGKFLTWKGVKDLVDAGFSIGSHTSTHRSLRGLKRCEALEELLESRNRIAQETGVEPKGLAYPYGTARDFSTEVANAAKEAGYLYAATAVNGLNYQGADLFTLRRTTITAGDGLRAFRMIMRGNLDPWALVDTYAYMFQRPSREIWSTRDSAGQ
jgi:peptidoglycan/xylan/chitin deacetylase (PgdA/CDA1 family)